ncbi:DNA-binding LacI/PurR family transcriptional regulator [Microbacteriaceae bacterium SG_E_30_P1]|uniref:DNA-binding LacI/PurR family transcriptional regulator n=1 Tax=Antiquaquibacter oligotrophicus TaxID=2880260 RepID=A0ABT6KPJ5_9MICO|nr:LacI family DNA-binding transcriptional regulator [Antiquaquibacter oligotrophicus]MDH6181921.1 DNA-binding LacI/PurR family transcriptional regulator [Antiquaquibacter oligotrophicus]UDF12408.1 LacI family DNA-binding transcriptional regulator [Antiquaquibacter oligotrophicus]
MASAGDGQKPNIRHVARLAGVSHTTVSRVINDHPRIAPETRERVLGIMRELNYRPNSAARALANRRTHRIGVIVDSVVEFGPGSTVRAIEEAAHERGYTVSTIAVDDRVSTSDALGTLDAIGVDGLCLITPRSSSVESLRSGALDVPALVVGPEPEPDFFTVSVDQRRGARLAVEHLIELGHRDILHLAGPLDWLDARARASEWTRCMTEAGLRPRPVVVGDWTSDSGYAFGRSLTTMPAFTAVFAANDRMALGLIHALHEQGIRVPDDISVIGFDDLPDARHFLPPLTTVSQDFRSLGVLSMETLLAAIERRDAPDRGLIEPHLVVRNSTAAPRS